MIIVTQDHAAYDVFRLFVDAYKLEPGESVFDFQPFISPDGKRIMFKVFINEAISEGARHAE